MRKITCNTILFAGLFIILTVSCRESEEDIKQIRLNREIYAYMKDIYFWNEYLPSVDYLDYETPEAFMEALCYKSIDRWSAVITKQDFNQYFEEGKMIGHGISFSADAFNNIRIAFVYRSTQAFSQGVRRGWIIQKVNGINATPVNIISLLGEKELGIKNDVVFINENEETVNISLIKEEVALTPVLFRDTLNLQGRVIGYIVFQDFIDAAIEELDEAFSFFITTGIQELIIDMRYNGGGSIEVAQHLAGWLMGKNHAGSPLINIVHNKNNSMYDSTFTIPVNSNGLSLDRIFFIGTDQTASASELIINGVKPYLTSILGGGYTHGKPVGMYAIPLDNAEYVILPVSFKYTNANDEGDFYNGLAPTFLSPDDVTRDFGDSGENSLESVLNYILTGTASYSDKKTTTNVRYIIRKDPLGDFLKAF